MGLPALPPPQQAGGGCPRVRAEVVLRAWSPSTDAVGEAKGGGAGLVGGHVGCGQVMGKACHSAACSLCLHSCHVSALFLKEPTLGIQKRVCFISCASEKSLEVILRRIKFLNLRGQFIHARACVPFG